MNHRILLVCLSLFTALACSSPPEAWPSDAAAQPGPDTSLVAEGKARASACVGCHGDDLAGGRSPVFGIYAPNLTPDMDTGLGKWSDAQIVTAMRTGKDDQGEDLCKTMPRFDTLSDDGAASLVAYLRSLDAVSHTTPAGTCEDAP